MESWPPLPIKDKDGADLKYVQVVVLMNVAISGNINFKRVYYIVLLSAKLKGVLTQMINNHL